MKEPCDRCIDWSESWKSRKICPKCNNDRFVPIRIGEVLYSSYPIYEGGYPIKVVDELPQSISNHDTIQDAMEYIEEEFKDRFDVMGEELEYICNRMKEKKVN